MGPYQATAKTLQGQPPRLATPVKSILKAASTLGKRSADDAGMDAAEIPESPTKRRKVLFDEVQNKVHLVGNRAMDEIKREVRDALEEHRRGNDGPYDTLKELFGNDRQRYLPPIAGEEEDTLKPQELRAYIVALTSCMPTLKEKDCNGLVKIVLRCSWLGRDEDFLNSYTYFLAALVSAQGSYLLPVLAMMVEHFKNTRSSSWNVADFPEITREEMRQRLHKTLKELLKMFPAAPQMLGTQLAAKFPYQNDSLRTHMAYIDNLFRVKEYVPSLREEILDLVLDRAVKIDSQMQMDLEDVDDGTTAAVMFALREKSRDPSQWEDDNSDDESDTESVDEDDPDYDLEAVKIKTVTENVEKMDAILDTLFAYHTSRIGPNPASETAFAAFTTILREFEQLVLPTYKSRHVQFLTFHFAQMDDRLSDAFCGQMINLSFDTTVPSILRQSCVAYLASFVARGAHVPKKDVQDIFDLLITHMNRYASKWESTCLGPDLQRFSHYYTMVQAVMYMFCFRWQDLVVSAPEFVDPEDPASYIGQDLEWFSSIKRDLQIHIFGVFNPLKVCAPVIVDEFAKLAHRLNFMYVHPLVEANKRIPITRFLTTYATGGALRDGTVEAGDERTYQLDPYFPFDPYQLPVSKRWLEGDYVHWRALPGLNIEDDEDDSDDMEEEEFDDDELEEATATDSEGADE